MGDCYALALSKGLASINPVLINLEDNRLTKTGTRALIKNLKPSLRYVCMSGNPIDEIGARELGEFAKVKANNLSELNLENTNLKDKGVISLCKQLADHPKLSSVNLSRNKITDVGCEGIAQLISDTFYITTLVLHWNYITGEGASRIIKATTKYGCLRVIDLSWNSIGVIKGNEFSKQFAEILSKATFNRIDVREFLKNEASKQFDYN